MSIEMLRVPNRAHSQVHQRHLITVNGGFALVRSHLAHENSLPSIFASRVVLAPQWRLRVSSASEVRILLADLEICAMRILFQSRRIEKAHYADS